MFMIFSTCDVKISMPRPARKRREPENTAKAMAGRMAALMPTMAGKPADSA
jgi:hypothetical protein